MKTGDVLLAMSGHQDLILQLSWSRDGSQILSRSDDNVLRIWDSQTGDLINEFVGGQSAITDARWSPEERALLTASEDGTVRLWYTQFSDLLAAACEIAPRNMTTEEWDFFFAGEAYRSTCPSE